ncbi:MAG: hypothetical protein RBR74_01135 [Ignavibacteriaceae bacterium]|jgi:hypothetical protein|nr:hypothetical protein [Ignavibacteriaceae bacterium]
MKDSIIEIQQREWTSSLESDNKSSFFNFEVKGKIKSRLGFIYFVALVSSLIILFAK